MYFTQGVEYTAHMPRETILHRFASTFYREALKTVQDRRAEIAFLGAGVAVYLLRLSAHGGVSWKAVRSSGWDACAVAVWGVCILIAWCAIATSITVSRQIAEEKTKPTNQPRYLPILSPSGGRIIATPAPENEYKHPSFKLWMLTVVVLGLCVATSYLVWTKAKVYEAAEPPKDPAPVDLTMGCKLGALPIHIAADSLADIIPLNQKRNRASKWGFFQVFGDSAKETLWPNKMPHLVRPDASDEMYKCTVKNFGSTNVGDIAINFKIYYGAQVKNDFDTYLVVVTPLPAGEHFNFFVINDCPVVVTAITPETVTLLVSGEQNRRQVSLGRPHANPLDQLLQFFPSTVQWTHEPCS